MTSTVKALTRVVVAPGGVLAALACQPPVTVRPVLADAPDTCALCLVGTAAGPLPGDERELELELAAGARASLRATGASLAQGTGPPARMATRVRLADGSALQADPGPLIVATGARVDVEVELALAGSAAVQWQETVVLGRTGEPPGAATVRWTVTRDGRPVLRQFTDLGPAETRGGHRVLAGAYRSDPGQPPGRTVVRSPWAVAQVLADGSTLATVLAEDAAGAAVELAALLTASIGPAAVDAVPGSS